MAITNQVQSYALVEMPWISSSQKSMNEKAKASTNVLTKFFYKYADLTLTAMEVVDKGSCTVAGAVYSTPVTGSPMAWSMRVIIDIGGLTIVALASLSIATTIISTSIAACITLGITILPFFVLGVIFGELLGAIRDAVLGEPEDEGTQVDIMPIGFETPADTDIHSVEEQRPPVTSGHDIMDVMLRMEQKKCPVEKQTSS